MPRSRVIHLALLAAFATTGSAAAQDIDVQLLFDGRPLRSTAHPAFSCFDELRQQWVACHFSAEAGPEGYVLERLAAGRYTLHIEIDDNTNNPGRFPGDYDVFQSVEITAETSSLAVDMKKVMRLTAPWDNNRDLDALVTQRWSQKPAIETRRDSISHTASVTFRWSPVVKGAVYHYVVTPIQDSPFNMKPAVLQGMTRAATVTLTLPRSAPGHYWAFGVTAERNGRPVGELLTHGGNAQGWTYNFTVRDWSPGPDAGTVTEVFQPRADGETPAARNARFLDEWRRAIPQPVWWDDVPRTSLRVGSVGDLSAAWQSDTSDEANRRRFYKLAYQAVLDHPGDDHLVRSAIDMMAFVADREDRLPLLQFGVEHFFSYNQRTDNCANCKIGDAAGQMVRDLAQAYIAQRDFLAAVDVIQRLVRERDTDVSAYNLALTFETMAGAYWLMNQPEDAKAALQEGLRRFPSGWQADQLRKTLARYEAAAVR